MKEKPILAICYDFDKTLSPDDMQAQGYIQSINYEVADKFKKIYASSFYFDNDGVAVWPAQVVNYTNKTQFLFRIEKGVLDVNDQNVNAYFEPSQYRVPFRNMVYIGDSDTDIPCMKLVNINGGHSIGVYNSETQDKSKVFRMLDENRIKYFVPADYTADSKLERLLKQIIDRTVSNEILEDVYFDCLLEKNEETKNQSEEELKKEELINRLEDSTSFANTHTIISQLNEIDSWSLIQKNKLIRIALNNNQVTYILKDNDIKAFYEVICEDVDSDDATKITELLNA